MYQRICSLKCVFVLSFFVLATFANTSSVFAQCSNPNFKTSGRKYIATKSGNFDINDGVFKIADFTGDGKADVAVIHTTLKIFPGDGNGGLLDPISSTIPADVNNLLFGDINGDGKPDVVLKSPVSSNYEVKTYLNNGSGSFSLANTVTLNGWPAAIADFNGDSKGDLVSGTQGGIQTRLGNGAGDFSAPVFYPTDSGTIYSTLVRDFNNDGKLDFVINSNSNNTNLRPFINDGNGNFSNNVAVAVSGDMIFTHTADVNNDGKLDFIGAPRNASNLLMIIFGDLGTPTAPSVYFTPGQSSGRPYISGVRDFNNDGFVDISIYGGNLAGSYGSHGTTVLYGNGTNNLTQVNNAYLGAFSDSFFIPFSNDNADFNGDGKADGAVIFNNYWNRERYIYTSLWTCGNKGQTKIVDFDGDSLTDLSLWNPTSGVWNIFRSTSPTPLSIAWGREDLGDIPTPGDFDGDGKSDFAVYRQPQGLWYILNSSDGSVRILQWGVNGDKPVIGDYDGDSKSDVAVWRPSDGVWYIYRSSNNQLLAYQFGASGDIPVQADFDGDEKTDVAVFRPSSTVWYYLRSSDGSFTALQWGVSTDKPVPEDYDGDGKADVAVFRPSGGLWYIIQSRSNSVVVDQWGVEIDVPMPVRFNGFSAISAVRRPFEKAFYIKQPTPPTLRYVFGNEGDKTVSTMYRVEQ